MSLKTRKAQLPKGLRGFLSRATGQYQAKLQRFEEESRAAQRRDRAAKRALVTKRLAERQALSREVQQQGLSSAFLGKVQLY